MCRKNMKRINSYGVKLNKDFCIKANIQEDIDNGIFDGMWRYDIYIETIEDVIGWMLECYDYRSYDVLEEWIRLGSTEVYGIDILEVKEALEDISILRHFADDEEKMIDFENLTKEEFLLSYSYLTEYEYDDTIAYLKYN